MIEKEIHRIDSQTEAIDTASHGLTKYYWNKPVPAKKKNQIGIGT